MNKMKIRIAKTQLWENKGPAKYSNAKTSRTKNLRTEETSNKVKTKNPTPLRLWSWHWWGER